MNISVYHRDKCRICDSSNLHKWICLSQMPLTDDLRLLDSEEKEFLYDINVYICKDCRTTQLLHDIDVQNYYQCYTYTSSASEFTKKFMSKLALNTFEEYSLKPGCSVIEIGSGDGLQLSYFKKLGAKVFGIEPSRILCKKSEEIGVPVYEGLFNEETITCIPKENLSADVILLTYTFDHMPEPMNFLKLVHRILNKKSGILIIEVHDLDKITDRCEYCLFEHEHLIYLSTETMRNILKLANFDLISMDILPDNERRGNSLLIVAKPNSKLGFSCIEYKERLLLSEYDKYNEEIIRSINRLDEFVESEISLGRRVAGYGAGGRGVMTLAAMKSAKKIAYVCDQNENFYGKVTPKSHLPIYHPNKLQEDPVDTLLVFSYGYIDEIKKTVAALQNPPKYIVSLLEVLQ